MVVLPESIAVLIAESKSFMTMILLAFPQTSIKLYRLFGVCKLDTKCRKLAVGEEGLYPWPVQPSQIDPQQVAILRKHFACAERAN